MPRDARSHLLSSAEPVRRVHRMVWRTGQRYLALTFPEPTKGLACPYKLGSTL